MQRFVQRFVQRCWIQLSQFAYPVGKTMSESKTAVVLLMLMGIVVLLMVVILGREVTRGSGNRRG